MNSYIIVQYLSDNI